MLLMHSDKEYGFDLRQSEKKCQKPGCSSCSESVKNTLANLDRHLSPDSKFKTSRIDKSFVLNYVTTNNLEPTGKTVVYFNEPILYNLFMDLDVDGSSLNKKAFRIPLEALKYMSKVVDYSAKNFLD